MYLIGPCDHYFSFLYPKSPETCFWPHLHVFCLQSGKTFDAINSFSLCITNITTLHLILWELIATDNIVLPLIFVLHISLVNFIFLIELRHYILVDSQSSVLGRCSCRY